MIYEIFIAIVIMGIVFTALGIFSRVIVLELLGYVTIFLMGVVLMTTGIDYKTGEITSEIYQYGNNFTGYHWDYETGTAPDGPRLDAYLFHKDITNSFQYTAYKNHTIGFFMSVISALSFALCWFNHKKRKGDYIGL